jgi:betaine-aldehyde dehydrogenase
MLMARGTPCARSQHAYSHTIEEIRTMKIHKQIYIGGNWIEPNGQQRIDVMNATTEEIIGRVPLGDATDADNAVRAARAAFVDWSRTTP